MRFNTIKTFSATKSRSRDDLGDRATEWLQENPAFKIQDVKVLQSSDDEYHCLTIVLFGMNGPRRRRTKADK
jgi:hypothetical protein